MIVFVFFIFITGCLVILAGTATRDEWTAFGGAMFQIVGFIGIVWLLAAIAS